MITSISPSSINTFDETTTFGCERRWWYKYVAKREEPQAPHLARGERLHKVIESYLKGHAAQGEGEEYGLFLAGQHIIDSVRPRVLAVEAPVNGVVADIPISKMSRCDVVLRDGILDWKTSSDIRRYGKTPEQLAKDTQLIIYARAFHSEKSEVLLAHGYFQTSKSKRAELVETIVSKKHLDEQYDNVIVPLVERMKVTSEVKDALEVKPNLKACRTCPHASICPQDGKDNAVMSFFSQFKAPAPVAPASPPPAPEPAPVLPPDAPKSDPAKAAEPVEGFSPVPPAKAEAAPPLAPEAPVKRGPGRPKGSKNKMKIVDVPNDPPPMQSSPSIIAPNPTLKPSPKGFTVTSVTVGKHLRIGLPNYSSVELHASLTAEGEDYEATLAALTVEVDKYLDAQAEPFKVAAQEVKK